MMKRERVLSQCLGGVAAKPRHFRLRSGVTPASREFGFPRGVVAVLKAPVIVVPGVSRTAARNAAYHG